MVRAVRSLPTRSAPRDTMVRVQRAARCPIAAVVVRGRTLALLGCLLLLGLLLLLLRPAAAAPPYAVQLNLVDDFLSKGWTVRCVRRSGAG